MEKFSAKGSTISKFDFNFTLFKFNKIRSLHPNVPKFRITSQIFLFSGRKNILKTTNTKLMRCISESESLVCFYAKEMPIDIAMTPARTTNRTIQQQHFLLELFWCSIALAVCFLAFSTYSWASWIVSSILFSVWPWSAQKRYHLKLCRSIGYQLIQAMC